MHLLLPLLRCDERDACFNVVTVTRKVRAILASRQYIIFFCTELLIIVYLYYKKETICTYTQVQVKSKAI